MGASPIRYVSRAAPILETGRLRLRAFEAADFERHFAMASDSRVRRHLPHMDREELWRRSVSGVGMWPVVGFGMWMVERRYSSEIIGHVGFFVAPRALDPSFEGEPEMGYMFALEAQGQGFAGEACGAALDWLDREVGSPAWAIIDPENAPSLRLAERLGFARMTETLYRDEPIIVFRRPAAA